MYNFFQSPIFCFPNLPPTYRNVAEGTDQNETITGSNFNDWIHGKGGNDTIKGSYGDDKIFGGNGNDELYGNTGNDILIGGYGNNTIDGGTGNDKIYAGKGDDNVKGGLGNDTIILFDDPVMGIPEDPPPPRNSVIRGGEGTDSVTLQGKEEDYEKSIIQYIRPGEGGSVYKSKSTGNSFTIYNDVETVKFAEEIAEPNETKPTQGQPQRPPQNNLQQLLKMIIMMLFQNMFGFNKTY